MWYDKEYNQDNIFCIVVCLFGACTDNTFVDGTDEARVEEGIPMTVDLSFQVEKTAVVQTRAAASVNAENKVLNIYVLHLMGMVP